MIIKEIFTRRSIRSYKSDPVSDENINQIVLAAQVAPTGMNTKTLEILVIRDQDVKAKLTDLLGQEFLKQAPVLLIPAVDSTKSKTVVQDLSVASENIFLQATFFGLGTVWKNVYSEKEEQLKKIVGIPQQFKVVNVIPLGYPAEKLPPHTEDELAIDRIHWDKWE